MGLSNPAVQVAYGLNTLPVYLTCILSAVIFIILYVFKAIGLSTMAKKRGMDKKVWAAFVPFASTWLIGELAGPVRVGKSKFAYFGLLAMFTEILLCVPAPTTTASIISLSSIILTFSIARSPTRISLWRNPM